MKQMSVTEAKAAVARIQAGHDELVAAIQNAYDGAAWAALGYADWEALCDAEFAGLELPQPAQQQLRDAGMSTRAIAAVSGTSKDTVARTTRVSQSATVKGRDGRTTTPNPSRGAKPHPTYDDPMHKMNERLIQVLLLLDGIGVDICNMDPAAVAADSSLMVHMQTITTTVRAAFGAFVAVGVDA